MRLQKSYKCPFCVSKIFKDFGSWEVHVLNMHEDELPDKWTPARYLYFMQTGMREGHCVECKQPTDWNEATHKYERYCKNPACKQAYVRTAKKRMIDTYGTEYILANPDMQRKMQAAKKMSGYVTFKDGGKIFYLSKLEKAFLEMLDSFGWSSNDVIGPSPNNYIYTYINENDKEHEGEHLYIPDYFIPSLNLEIEIKTQLNKHHKIQRIDKVKEAEKDAMMEKLVELGKINYLKLSDGNYESFYQFILDIRDNLTSEEKLIQKASEKPVLETLIPEESLYLDIGMESILPDTSEFIDIALTEENKEHYKFQLSGIDLLPIGENYATGIIKNGMVGNFIGYYVILLPKKLLITLEILPEWEGKRYDLAVKTFLTKKYGLEGETAEGYGSRVYYEEEGHDTIVQLLPNEKPYGVDVFLKNMSDECYMISDTHIMTYDEANRLRLASITKKINDTVKENDHLFILGDLGGKRGYESLEDTEKFVKSIKCRNLYLVIGNHDKYKIQDYVKMGFKMITDKVTWKNIVFSHVPIKVEEGMINVHGHNHGERCYINDGVSENDHIDVYNPEFIPRKLKDILKSYQNPNKDRDLVGAPIRPEFANEAYIKEGRGATKGIFIALTNSHGTIVAKGVSAVTHADYTHIAISFNIQLEPLYTMGYFKDEKTGKTKSGLKLESPTDDFYRDGIRASYIIYYLELEDSLYQKIKERLNEMLDKKDSYHYSILQLFKILGRRRTKASSRFVCSTFVAYLLSAAIELDKDFSLYQPTQIQQINATLIPIDKGEDFYRYNYRRATQALKHYKEDYQSKVLIQNNLDQHSTDQLFNIATESFIGEKVETYKGFWKEKLFGNDSDEVSALVGRKTPQKSPYLTLKKVVVDLKRSVISIQHINCRLLMNRIKETYDERKLEYIFEIMYDKKDIGEYLRKRKSRNQMKITALESPLFFAMELSILFMELYNKYLDRNYKIIAQAIYEKTWLKDADTKKVSPISKTNLIQLSDKFKLKDHQMEFITLYPELKVRLNLNGYILAFDQGLGKTLTATALSLCLQASKVYIVCPNSLKLVWKNELSKYLKRYENNPVLADKEIIVCDRNSNKNGYANGKYFITNNESISAMFPYISGGPNSMLIVDEMHNFRNLHGERTEELLELKKRIQPKDILLMSGTPMKASPNELVPSLKLLDPLFTDEAADVYNRCFNLNTTMAMTVVRKRFGYIMYRKTKDILDLPTKTVQDLRLNISDPKPYLMSNIRTEVDGYFGDFYLTELNKNIDYRDEFVRLVKYYSSASKQDTDKYLNWIIKTVNTNRTMSMHEIDKVFIDTFIDTYVKPNIRLEKDLKKVRELERIFIRMEQSCMSRALGQVYPPRRTQVYSSLFLENQKAIIDMIVNRTKKTVIFSQFLGVIHTISDTLTKAGVKNVKIVGGTSDRMEQIDQFKHDDRTLVLLATSQTLGTGVTLTEASQMFFFGPPWRSTDFDQCCDRIYRIGQTSDVIIYNVILSTTEYNLTDRMNKILNWSNDMFGAAINDAQLDGVIESTIYNTTSSILSELVEWNNSLIQMSYLAPEDFMVDYHCKNPKEFIKDGGGVCWDYVGYQASYLKKNFKNLYFKTFYNQYSDENFSNMPSHTFLLIYYDNKVYWMEASWKDHAGVFEFDSISDALTFILNELKRTAEMECDSRMTNTFLCEYNALDAQLFGKGCVEYMEYMWNLQEYQFTKVRKKIKPKKVSSNSIGLEQTIQYRSSINSILQSL